MSIRNTLLTLQQMRRAAAELLACAVLRIFPEAFLIRGDAAALGFYYDFAFEMPLLGEMLARIEEEMYALYRENPEVKTLNMMRENAANFFRHEEQDFQADSVLEIQENIVSILRIGDFYDYCPLPHPVSLKEIGPFKLQKIVEREELLSDDSSVIVTRISGTAFFEKKELQQFLKCLDRAEQLNHRVLGREMDLFSGQEVDGIEDWLWHPRGVRLRELLVERWQKAVAGLHYEKVMTPSIVLPSVDAWKSGGRTEGHALIFQRRGFAIEVEAVRYSEWVNWMAEYGDFEEGLLDVYSSWSDFQTIFCSKDQILKELKSSLQIIEQTVRLLGIEYYWCLAFSHQDFSPSSKEEYDALELIKRGMQELGLVFSLEETEDAGSRVAAEVRLKDSLGREWKGPFVEADFETAKRLDLKAPASEKMQWILVWSLFGSLERIIALMIEKYKGMLPLMLVPEQVRIIAVGESTADYAQAAGRQLVQKGVRVGLDLSAEKLGAKVHRAEKNRVPYIVIVGEKERNRNELAVRKGGRIQKPVAMSIERLVEQIREREKNEGR